MVSYIEHGDSRKHVNTWPLDARHNGTGNRRNFRRLQAAYLRGERRDQRNSLIYVAKSARNDSYSFPFLSSPFFTADKKSRLQQCRGAIFAESFRTTVLFVHRVRTALIIRNGPSRTFLFPRKVQRATPSNNRTQGIRRDVPGRTLCALRSSAQIEISPKIRPDPVMIQVRYARR